MKRTFLPFQNIQIVFLQKSEADQLLLTYFFQNYPEFILLYFTQPEDIRIRSTLFRLLNKFILVF